ncbi:MAG: YcgL domain-containing protein [Congregibacter sp.]
MSSPLICEVFKSPKREGMYLFVERSEGLSRVPESLLEGFGTPQSVMVMHLKEQRRLAQANAQDVLTALESEGYYLQLPPATVRASLGSAGDASAIADELDGRSAC